MVQQRKAPAPAPVAKKIPFRTRVHGVTLPDDYRWMHKKKDPSVVRYLKAENDYADGDMAKTAAFQKKLYKEMLSHIKEDDSSVPCREGSYYYYSRWQAGKQYQVHLRKKAKPGAREEITLDVNQLARGESFMALGAYEISDDEKLLAYSTDNSGFRQYTLRVRDLATGKDFADRIEKTGSVAWDRRRNIYYTVEDHAKRHYRLYRHALGTPVSKDELIYEEKDERFSVYAYRSLSGRYLFMVSDSHTTSEVRFLDLEKPGSRWQLVEKRKQDQEYSVDHGGEWFYIRTNDKGRNFRLVRTPVGKPGRANWKELEPCRKDSMLLDAEVYADFYVLHENERGLPQLTVVPLGKGKRRRIEFPEPVYMAGPQANLQFKTGQFRYSYQSPVTPNSVYDYDVKTGKSKLLKRTEVPGGFDGKRYACERLWATARDGEKVPVSVVYRKGMRTGKDPLYVYGYGSYGYALPTSFNATRLCLLDRGVVMAFAHVRGGGDLGKPWHDAGRLMKKMNSFTDFIDCTEFLVKKKYGAAGRIAALGRSAGGLLMGGIANMRPDLYRAIVSDVPFVDVMNTMLDSSLPLTVGEYEEWGNPKDKRAFDYMLKYSPYDQMKPVPYPATLVRASYNDSQVMYWEAAKYVARLRTINRGKLPLYLKTDMSSGHGGASGRYDYLKDVAFDYAFMLRELGVPLK